jgi:hypothetical protein
MGKFSEFSPNQILGENDPKSPFDAAAEGKYIGIYSPQSLHLSEQT